MASANVDVSPFWEEMGLVHALTSIVQFVGDEARKHVLAGTLTNEHLKAGFEPILKTKDDYTDNAMMHDCMAGVVANYMLVLKATPKQFAKAVETLCAKWGKQ